MFETPDGTPTDFAAFQASRRRFLDALAADALLTRIERGCVGDAPRQEETVEPTIVIEGDLVILTGERRLVLGYFSPTQRDLADVVRDRLGLRDEAFGVGQVGPVRITVERVPDAISPGPPR